jgi:uncharacterized protein
MDFVLIPSTLCNLRCSYCYEFEKLSDKRRMSHEDLRTIFTRVAEFVRHRNIQRVRFIWHGGEPLLLSPDYFWKAFDLQKAAFGELDTEVLHATQTNLTVLDEARLDLLVNGFDLCGVSLDVLGDLRVDGRGQCAEHKAIKNLDRLLGTSAAVGGITVLSKEPARRIEEVYRFYLSRGLGFRALPLHEGEQQPNQGFEAEPQETLEAFCKLVDMWLQTPKAPMVHPVVNVIRDVATAYDTGVGVEPYAKGGWPVLGVDREGFVYGYEDIHNRARSFGSVFAAPLDGLLNGPLHERLVEESIERMSKTCGGCKHFGRTCSGKPVAEGAQERWDRNPDGSIRCTVFSSLIDHVERRLSDAGLLSSNMPIQKRELERPQKPRRSLPIVAT